MISSRPTALIVEGQPFVGLVASDILCESGFDTLHAFDAKDAAATLADHPEIQVMITDADLPGEIDGLELCRRVSRERPYVQLVVATSGYGLEQSEAPRGVRVLRKPFASGELRKIVAAESLSEYL